MGYNDQDPNQQQQGGYNQQLAQQDQTNRGYRQRLVNWMLNIDELAMLVEHDTLMGQFDRVLVYKYATEMMGLWRAVKPQLQRKNNENLLQGKEKDDFDYFENYNDDIAKFVEPSSAVDENGKEYIDFKNIDDLNKLHNVLLNALVKLDVLSSNVGY